MPWVPVTGHPADRINAKPTIRIPDLAVCQAARIVRMKMIYDVYMFQGIQDLVNYKNAVITNGRIMAIVVEIHARTIHNVVSV